MAGPLLVPLALAALDFIMSGGINLAERQVSGQPNQTPSLQEWLPILASTALGGVAGPLGDLAGPLSGVAKVGLLTGGPLVARTLSSQANQSPPFFPGGTPSAQPPTTTPTYPSGGFSPAQVSPPTPGTYGNAQPLGYGTTFSASGSPTGGSSLYPTGPVYPSSFPAGSNNPQLGTGNQLPAFGGYIDPNTGYYVPNGPLPGQLQPNGLRPPQPTARG